MHSSPGFDDFLVVYVYSSNPDCRIFNNIWSFLEAALLVVALLDGGK